MPRTLSIRLQTALVIALFLGSLATVLFSTFQTLLLPQCEFQVRDLLRGARLCFTLVKRTPIPARRWFGGI